MMSLRKPLRGATLNRAHPLTRGLGYAFVHADLQWLNDAVNGLRSSVTAGAPSVIAGQGGEAIYFPSGAYTSTPALLAGTGDWTVAFIASADSLAAWKAVATVGSYSPALYLSGQNSGYPGTYWNGPVNSTLPITAGQFHRVVIVGLDSVPAYGFCVDGTWELVTGFSESWVGPWPAGALKLATEAAGASPLIGAIESFFLWPSRGLSQAEAQAWCANPYGMFGHQDLSWMYVAAGHPALRRFGLFDTGFEFDRSRQTRWV